MKNMWRQFLQVVLVVTTAVGATTVLSEEAKGEDPRSKVTIPDRTIEKVKARYARWLREEGQMASYLNMGRVATYYIQYGEKLCFSTLEGKSKGFEHIGSAKRKELGFSAFPESRLVYRNKNEIAIKLVPYIHFSNDDYYEVMLNFKSVHKTKTNVHAFNGMFHPCKANVFGNGRHSGYFPLKLTVKTEKDGEELEAFLRKKLGKGTTLADWAIGGEVSFGDYWKATKKGDEPIVGNWVKYYLENFTRTGEDLPFLRGFDKPVTLSSPAVAEYVQEDRGEKWDWTYEWKPKDKTPKTTEQIPQSGGSGTAKSPVNLQTAKIDEKNGEVVSEGKKPETETPAPTGGEGNKGEKAEGSGEPEQQLRDIEIIAPFDVSDWTGGSTWSGAGCKETRLHEGNKRITSKCPKTVQNINLSKGVLVFELGKALSEKDEIGVEELKAVAQVSADTFYTDHPTKDPNLGTFSTNGLSFEEFTNREETGLKTNIRELRQKACRSHYGLTLVQLSNMTDKIEVLSNCKKIEFENIVVGIVPDTSKCLEWTANSPVCYLLKTETATPTITVRSGWAHGGYKPNSNHKADLFKNLRPMVSLENQVHASYRLSAIEYCKGTTCKPYPGRSPDIADLPDLNIMNWPAGTDLPTKIRLTYNYTGDNAIYEPQVGPIEVAPGGSFKFSEEVLKPQRPFTISAHTYPNQRLRHARIDVFADEVTCRSFGTSVRSIRLTSNGAIANPNDAVIGQEEWAISYHGSKPISECASPRESGEGFTLSFLPRPKEKVDVFVIAPSHDFYQLRSVIANSLTKTLAAKNESEFFLLYQAQPDGSLTRAVKLPNDTAADEVEIKSVVNSINHQDIVGASVLRPLDYINDDVEALNTQIKSVVYFHNALNSQAEIKPRSLGTLLTWKAEGIPFKTVAMDCTAWNSVKSLKGSCMGLPPYGSEPKTRKAQSDLSDEISTFIQPTQ
ncbi:hypothetical protein [Terasakiella sp. SH-1]|uniref:hypothetical protein n=1 Tax=Terasakiella sp. SH-1 TaxID=2560057 RepID=UPI001073B7D7|nr:hypothetical protein [Terasakiella sp. SH-1]